MTTRYQVGQRLRHPQFGEGLVVEVHTDRGREVLEVVFNGELRRLSAVRDWELVEGTPSAPVAAVAPPSVVAAAEGEATRPAPARVWHPQGDALVRLWSQGKVSPSSHFDLRSGAERWAGWAEPDRLVSLDSL